MLDNEFYNFLQYIIIAVNIILFADVLIQTNKILFIRKKLGNKFNSIPKLHSKLRFTDIFIILIWLVFAGFKIYSVVTNPVGFFGNLDYLLIIFAFLAMIDRIIGLFISNGFGTLSITFFYSENGIVIYNPLRKVSQFNILKHFLWTDISKIDMSIFDINRRIWKFNFHFSDENSLFIILEDNQKEILKKIIAQQKIKFNEFI